MSDKEEGWSRPSGDGDATAFGVHQATEAVEKLRGVVDQASRSMRDLTQATEQWAQETQTRAREMAKEWRAQGSRAMGTVSHQVEQNPMISLAIAFAVGFLAASLTRR